MKELRFKFISNLIYAFGAQSISLILSILMSLVVPKILGVEDYSFWQLFIFYIGYVGFSHLGLIDGIYLRIGGKEYTQLNYSVLGSQFWISFFFQSIIAIILIIISYRLGINGDRFFVIEASVIYMLLHNANAYIGYIFQAVNKTQKYSISVIIDRIVFILIILISILYTKYNYKYYIIMYIVAKTISLIYCIIQGKDIIFTKISIKLSIIKDMLNSIIVGSKLLIANIASMLIIGIGRLFIDNVWGITTFGKISFSLSLTNFLLQFVGQVSMVLFPSLRRMNNDEQRLIYVNLRNSLALLIPIIFIVYIPIKSILGLWLPEYQESLEYMTYLLPICVFDGKMQLLCNTYFKVLRKENWLLKINIYTSILSLVLYYFSAYIVGNLNFMIISMVIVIGFRSIVSEVHLSKIMKTKILKNLIFEIIMILLFIIFSRHFSLFKMFWVYCISYSIYAYFYRDIIKRYYNLLINFIINGKRSKDS